MKYIFFENSYINIDNICSLEIDLKGKSICLLEVCQFGGKFVRNKLAFKTQKLTKLSFDQLLKKSDFIVHAEQPNRNLNGAFLSVIRPITNKSVLLQTNLLDENDKIIHEVWDFKNEKSQKNFLKYIDNKFGEH